MAIHCIICDSRKKPANGCIASETRQAGPKPLPNCPKDFFHFGRRHLAFDNVLQENRMTLNQLTKLDFNRRWRGRGLYSQDQLRIGQRTQFRHRCETLPALFHRRKSLRKVCTGNARCHACKVVFHAKRLADFSGNLLFVKADRFAAPVTTPT